MAKKKQLHIYATPEEAYAIAPTPTSVVVGQKYKVVCMVREVDGDRCYIPIIGGVHSDTFLQTPHVHTDNRFKYKRRGEPQTTNRTPRVEGINSNVIGYAVKSFLAIHTVTGLPSSKGYSDSDSTIIPWQKSMRGKKCNGTKCPHWGIEMHPRENGYYECPLHGLWAKDGVIVAPDESQIKIETC